MVTPGTDRDYIEIVMLLRASLGTLAVALVAAALPAHGGQYQPGPVVVPPGIPVTGGSAPPTPRPASSNTGFRKVAPSVTRWQTWWEFNKRPFLQRRVVEDDFPISGSDDFYLGVRRREERVDMLEPTEADLRDRVVPALGRVLEKERNRDIVTACLVALAKIGRDGPGVDLEAVLEARIPRDDQEVRETAVLALGIAGRKKALPTLGALLRDDAEGRRLEQRAEVKDRTRAFAAYGLGLLAARAQSTRFKRMVHDELLRVLQDPEVDDRDLSVAALSSLGILGLEGSGAQKRLLWQTVDELTAYFEEDRGRGHEIVQAHAPIAIGRLLGRGSSDLHQKCKSRFAAALSARRGRSNPVLRSCAIALGMLVEPVEDSARDERFSRALQRYYERGRDQNARYFALISLGRIGGASNREFLVRSYLDSNKGTERPWAALALGVLSFDRGSAGEPDETVASMLLEDLRSARDNSLRGALAIALGLTGHSASSPAVMRMLLDNENEQYSAGYLCLSVALLGDRSSASVLGRILARSERRPFLLRQCAVALGQLGDRNASLQLIDMMQRSGSVAVLSALAIAVGRIGDRRSIEPLIAMLEDKEMTKLGRGFVAAALGGIGDKEELPFNAPLTVDCNYTSSVDTLTNGITGILDIL